MRYCFCVLGWYFYPDFFEQLNRMPGDKYVVSHREPDYFKSSAIPAGVQERLRLFPNVGLDWGLYSQFKEGTDLSGYDFVIYVHDDVVLKDLNFPERIIELFADQKIKVVGNGKNGTDWQFPYAKYRKRMVGEEEDDFVVRTVRGSFFAARTDIFATIGNFPVYWKAQAGLKQNKGNVSLRNFGYLITKHFGAESITYLDWDHYLDTPYLSELVRGQPLPPAV